MAGTTLVIEKLRGLRVGLQLKNLWAFIGQVNVYPDFRETG